MHEYNMTMSDLMMKIGSQLWMVIMLILVLWSEEKGAIPGNNIRRLLTGDFNRKTVVSAAPASAVSK
jgi:hypothetical protein